MTFHSILFERTEDSIEETIEMPVFFVDLNLDQVIDAITKGRQEYDLKPFFYTSLKNPGTIKYRQEIARDLENESLSKNIRSFAVKMSVMRRYLGFVDKLDFKYHKEGWFLETVDIYCDAVNCLANDLSLVNLQSRGLLVRKETCMTLKLL